MKSQLTRMQMEAFARQLRADSGTPTFSTALHDRIMATLRVRGLDPVVEPPRRTSPWVIGLRMAAPLAVAAAIALFAWFNMQPPVTPQSPTVNETPMRMPSFPDRVIEPVTLALTPTASALDAQKYGRLDEDAQRLAVFVADQLPSFNVTSVRQAP